MVKEPYNDLATLFEIRSRSMQKITFASNVRPKFPTIDEFWDWMNSKYDLHKIGQGAFSIVRKGTQGGAKFVLKVPTDTYLNKAGSIDPFWRYAELSRKYHEKNNLFPFVPLLKYYADPKHNDYTAPVAIIEYITPIYEPDGNYSSPDPEDPADLVTAPIKSGMQDLRDAFFANGGYYSWKDFKRDAEFNLQKMDYFEYKTGYDIAKAFMANGIPFKKLYDWMEKTNEIFTHGGGGAYDDQHQLNIGRRADGSIAFFDPIAGHTHMGARPS